jgi:hypothetical protein
MATATDLMDYKWHYDSLVNKARSRQAPEYVERHHIVPRCMGGSDSADNLVSLTPEEHFVAHLLLAKIFAGNVKVLHAAMAMQMVNRETQRREVNNKRYGWLRKRFSEARRGHVVPEETRDKIRAALTGRRLPDEQRRKLREANIGRVASEETREKMRAAQLGKKHRPETIEKLKLVNRREFSEETKAKLRGRKHTPEAIAKIVAASTGRKHSEEALAKMRGRTLPPETRAKISAARKTSDAVRAVNEARRGTRHSGESIRKMREVQKGKVISPEQRAKISASKKGKKLSPEDEAKRLAALRASLAARTPEERSAIVRKSWEKRKAAANVDGRTEVQLP